MERKLLREIFGERVTNGFWREEELRNFESEATVINSVKTHTMVQKCTTNGREKTSKAGDEDLT